GASLALSLGCSTVIDYRTNSVADQIRAAITASGHTFTAAYDAHSGPSGSSTSYETLAAALQPAGGKIATVLPYPLPETEAAKLPANVPTISTNVGSSYFPTAVGGDGDFGGRWFRQIGVWVEKGILKPNVVEIVPRGLAGVPEGLKRMEEGKISGVKLVYRIADTPAL
ncbi:hypothetical protein HDU93_008572, partial [Gonapodya sp. JEL0774]